GPRAVAAVAGYVRKVVGKATTFAVALSTPQTQHIKSRAGDIVVDLMPLKVSASADVDVPTFTSQITDALEDLRPGAGLAADFLTRYAMSASDLPLIGVRISSQAATDHVRAPGLVDGTALTFVVSENTGDLELIADDARVAPDEFTAIKERFEHFALAFSAAGDETKLIDLSLMPQETIAHLRDGVNRTTTDYDVEMTIPQLFAAQASRTPDATALVAGSQTMTYRQLAQSVQRVAATLASYGVKPDDRVGVYIDRSCDLVVAALGIMTAGAAYVPLDPSYPAQRIEMMITDSGMKQIVTRGDLVPPDPIGDISILRLPLDATPNVSASDSATLNSGNLAYVIYTSGSTGRPKGVTVTHRNVVNFFAGMDAKVPLKKDSQTAWIAVTSLSFDISVLELFWTLCRGCKVVIYAENRPGAAQDEARSEGATSVSAIAADASATTDTQMDFGLFFWGNDDGPGSGKYRLLIEGAKFADANGFTAVWTPERHFHAFGGPYPNPAVTGAAVAAITQNVSIRAGSCVLPLHHPARVAEDWAVIDNLSDGRVGLAIAAGWMPEDFVLRPENTPPKNKASMFRDIDILRRLWRGDQVAFPMGDNKPVKVRTLPRPVQDELPIWVTIAGNAEMFRQAAQAGANVLTHLLGQSINEVAEKVQIYHDELRACGRDPDDHKVTLMLHTLVGSDREAVREAARGPMVAYLKSAAGLIKQYAWAFPAFKKPEGVDKPFDINLGDIEPEDFEAIMEFAFLRYFEDSGLFGTVDDCLSRVRQLKAIGVDEIACLIDFGVDTQLALDSLLSLADVVAACQATDEYRGSPPPPAPMRDASDAQQSFVDLVRENGVSHLQCTPSMATSLLLNEDNRPALSEFKTILLGGEPLSQKLVSELRTASNADILNMYGPTETTIWSAVWTVDPVADKVSLGEPIANTQLYILDEDMRMRPPGLPGELYIGGDGVTRGYLGRPDLTEERFVEHPFAGRGARLYKTGDLVVRNPDETLQFLGRTDHQVKIRGYRIEIMEIETTLLSHPEVSQGCVVTQTVADDIRIAAVMMSHPNAPTESELRAYMSARLPDFMLPAQYVWLDALPLTPNAKIDRKALSEMHVTPSATPKDGDMVFEQPETELEQRICSLIGDVLSRAAVGLSDNFFLIGGHSLLAIRLQQQLRAALNAPVSITDIYRFPVARDLAAHLRDKLSPEEKTLQPSGGLQQAANRAAKRRELMARRS
ncbi:MAG: MupA/Atu3671 family FMN-dependent luciferase-like monooxygenase, partial [Pseudomonadota bacterium]